MDEEILQQIATKRTYCKALRSRFNWYVDCTFVIDSIMHKFIDPSTESNSLFHNRIRTGKPLIVTGVLQLTPTLVAAVEKAQELS